jgi:tetrapyrrole methylase family protein/MazG family protein
MTISICGLGPGPASLLTRETEDLLASGTPVILRTRRHPTLAEIPESASWPSCDDLYESGAAFGPTYEAIAARVLAEAARGDVVYAVPGHPLLAEQSVVLLLEAAHAAGVATRVLPAVSFADVASVALGRDLSGVQLCDATAFVIDPRRSALISQVWDRATASAVKLALLDLYPAEHPVTVLHALATPEERCTTVTLDAVDHRPTGHLDAFFVPALDLVDDVRHLDGVAAIVHRLHAEGGCPWDREQTHASLRPHLLEEGYEVLDAIDADDPAALQEELGDLLLQVLMHAEVADREGSFALGDVAEGIGRKLVRRHPHVFGGAAGGSAGEVYRNWDALKRAEKPRDSILDGVPASLPALAASHAMQGRARRAGFDWRGVDGPLEKLREEIAEFATAEGAADREEEFGDILFVLAGIGQRLGLDAEQALRVANAKFRRRYGEVERLARERGLDLAALEIDEVEALWQEAKAVADSGPRA